MLNNIFYFWKIILNSWQIFRNIVQRELLIYLRSKSDWLGVLIFFALVVCLFPIALGVWATEQLWMVPAIIWIAALLATMLAQDNLLRTDYQLGIIDQMLLSNYPLYWQLLAKIAAHWLLFGAPLALCTPLLALSFGAPTLVVITISLSLLFGTLILSLLAALGAALTVSLARGGLLLTVLMLPLLVPVVVLGVSFGILSVQGVFSMGHFALLAAVLIASILGAPLVIGMAIKAGAT